VGIAELREVTLATPDGLALLAWFAPPADGKPVALYFHGNAGNLQDRANRIRAFTQAGYGVLIPEYRGYGGNPGTPNETAFFEDARIALEYLHTQGFDDARVVIFGESLGTGVAVATAAGRSVAALVLEAPYTTLAVMTALRFPYLPTGLMLEDRFDSLSRIGQVRAPILIMQGDQDSVVPPSLGQALYAAAPNPKELWVAKGGGHADLMQFGSKETVLNFLSRVLPQARRD
jgi:fermentation-respiration switch protein FrsA (DUF1100 family)